jgi:hypothetical protein
MTISPKLRTIQQSYLVQTIIIPAGITFGGATIIAILTASGGNLATLSELGFKTALGLGGFAALTYIAGIYQHGLGSASFHSDGSPNKMVDKVAAETAAESGPDAERLDVEVVRK